MKNSDLPARAQSPVAQPDQAVVPAKKKASDKTKPGSTRPTAIFVAGMHRSGTSATTRVLALLGCALPQALLPASRGDNDLGFWESKPIMDLNNDIIAAAGSSWDDWNYFQDGWIESGTAEPFKARAADLLREEFQDAPLIVMKDPRICRFLPLWVEAAERAGYASSVVVPIRNPVEVAASLNKRNQIDPALAQLVWLRHTLDAEKFSRGLPRSYVSYANLVADWRSVVGKIQSDIGLLLPRQSALSEDEVDQFLDPSLRRNRAGENVSGKSARQAYWVSEAYDVFARWAEGNEQPEDAGILQNVRDAFDQATPEFSRVVYAGVKAAKENRLLQKELEGVKAEATSLTEKLDARNQEVTAISEKLTAKDKDLSASQEKSRGLESQLANDQQAFEQKLSELEARRSEAQKQLEALRPQLESQFDQERRALQEQLSAVNAELDAVRKERADLAATLEQKVSQLSAEIELVRKTGRDALLESQTRLAAAQKGQSDAAKKNESLQGEIELIRTTGQSALKELQQLVSLGESRLAEAQDRADTAIRRVSELSEENAVLQKNSDAEIRSLRAKVDELERNQTVRFREIAALTTLLRQKEQEADAASAACRNLLRLAVRRAALPNIPLLRRLPLWKRIGVNRIRAELLGSGVFDQDWYLKNNPDVQESGMDAIEHYIVFGLQEGRKASPLF
jgi:hypothetical protein